MTDDGMRLAKELRVVREPGGVGRLYIDGELFELYTRDGFAVEVRKNEISGVTLTIAAENVIVEDRRTASTPKAVQAT